MLSSCATQPASTPDTEVIEKIQSVFEEAAAQESSELATGTSDEILNELLPSLSLDEALLTPVEERVTIIAPNMPAPEFFNSLVVGTDYGVAISEDVEVMINLSLPGVTIQEAMDTVADLYSLDITRRGNIYRKNRRPAHPTVHNRLPERSALRQFQYTSQQRQQSGYRRWRQCWWPRRFRSRSRWRLQRLRRQFWWRCWRLEWRLP